jgi:hypothetical protein
VRLKKLKKLNSVARIREQTTPTEWPQPVTTPADRVRHVTSATDPHGRTLGPPGAPPPPIHTHEDERSPLQSHHLPEYPAAPGIKPGPPDLRPGTLTDVRTLTLRSQKNSFTVAAGSCASSLNVIWVQIKH